MARPAKDLADFHQPIGKLFSQPSASMDWDALRLSEAQVAFFHAHGYVAGIRLLSDRQIDALRAELAELVQPDHAGNELWYEYHSNESSDPDTVLFHALGAWRIREAFHDLLWSPAFTVPAGQLLKGPVRFWHDQLFCKPAHHGGGVAWHQDYSYWTRTQPMAHLTCWIGLDDSTVENGCVHYIPGSHRWELLPITGLAGDVASIRQVLSDQQWEQLNDPRPVELDKGECSFHHPLMVHGSFENRTDHPRRATVINVVRDGVCSASSEPLLQGIPPVPEGVPLSGRYFPLLSRADDGS